MTGGQTPRWVWRLRHALVCLMMTAFSLNTGAGALVNDTKLDLVLDPVGFMQRATHMWDPTGSAGQLQNQAYGYLFPMGPFFALCQAVGVPGWATQRLWWGLLLSVSYLGFLLLARRLGVGTDWSRLVAGTAFALSPHVLTVLGRSSVEVWPPALAPLVVAPLVGPGAFAHPRRAAAFSGLVVAATGGVNATVNLAATLPAALWLLTRPWDRRTLRLGLWWVAAVGAASLWWLVPLLALGRYSPPFLDYIEPASITTSTTHLVEVLRGASGWVGYLPDAGSPGGYALRTQPVPILLSVVVAATGMAGIAWRATPHRRWLVVSLLVGVVLVTLGHVGSLSSAGAPEVRALLDGPLAPLRNVHKFDVLVRLATTLGLGAALAAAAQGRSHAEQRLLRPVVAAAGAFAVVGTASPFFGLAVAPARSFQAVPGYWVEALSWLAEHRGAGRTLLLPGSRFADYEWGYPGDEPIQAARGVAWDVRNAVPLTDPGHVRWLDGLEQRVADGLGGADLAPALAEGGVDYVLVRSDLGFGRQGATRPTVVRAALRDSPGLERVAVFGPMLGGPGMPGLASDEKLTVPAPALEIYAVRPGNAAAVDVLPASALRPAVAGAEQGSRDGASGGFVRVPPGSAPPSWADEGVLLTDTPARREVNAGVGAFGASYTLTKDDRLRIRKRVRDYGAVDTAGAEAVAAFEPGYAVDSSSSAGDADAYPVTDRGALPYAAFDGTLRTTWRPNPQAGLTGSWVSLTVPQPVSTAGGVVVLDPGTAIRRLSLTTVAGTTTLAVEDDRAVLPAATTSWLRLGIAEVDPTGPTPTAGIREVVVPGLAVRRTVQLPRLPAGAAVAGIRINGDTGRPGCVDTWTQGTGDTGDTGGTGGDAGVRCAVGLGRVGEDAAGLDRQVDLPRAQQVTPALTARAVPGPQLTAAVAAARRLPWRVSASTTAVPDLAGAALSAVDSDRATTWVADPRDPDPTLTLTFAQPTTLSRLNVFLDEGAAAAAPKGIRVVAGGRSRQARLGVDGTARFASLTGTRFTIHLEHHERVGSLDPYTLRRTELGVGVTEIEGLPGAPAAAQSAPVTFGCDIGPRISVGDQVARFRVETTVGALLRGAPVEGRPCSTREVMLAQGRVDIRALDPGRWDVATLDLQPHGAAAGTTAPTPARVTAWAATFRSVEVGDRAAEAVLRVRENANPGWQASLDGRPLRPVTVNGWQQGYMVPAGAAGRVDLTFTPDLPVRWGMLGAALLPVLLLVGVLVPEGPVAGAAGSVTGPARRLRGRRLVPAVGGVAVVAIGGWYGIAGLVGWATVVVARRSTRRQAVLSARVPRLLHRLPPAAVSVAGCYLAAGIVLSAAPFNSGRYAAGALLVQLACLVGLVGLVAVVTDDEERLQGPAAGCGGASAAACDAPDR